jgi:hypothetical protein
MSLVAQGAFDRWSVEQTIKDSNDLLGAGDAANRLSRSNAACALRGAGPDHPRPLVRRARHPDTDLAATRTRVPWNRKNTHVSIDETLIACRRARIASLSAAQDTVDVRNS